MISRKGSYSPTDADTTGRDQFSPININIVITNRFKTHLFPFQLNFCITMRYHILNLIIIIIK